MERGRLLLSAALRLRVTVSARVMPGFCGGGGGGAVSVGQVLSLLETSQGPRGEGRGQANGISRAPQV